MKRIMWAAMAVALTLSMSGCGHKTSAAGKESDDQKRQDAQLAFSQCMRDNGIPAFPDPQFNADGGGGLMMDSSSGMDPDSQKFKDAQSACQSKLDAVMGEGDKQTPEERQQMQDTMLAYAQCMRDHGVDMADPTFNDQGHVDMRMGGEDVGPPSDADKAKMQDAERKCQASNPMRGNGESTHTEGGGAA